MSVMRHLRLGITAGGHGLFKSMLQNRGFELATTKEGLPVRRCSRGGWQPRRRKGTSAASSSLFYAQYRANIGEEICWLNTKDVDYPLKLLWIHIDMILYCSLKGLADQGPIWSSSLQPQEIIGEGAKPLKSSFVARRGLDMLKSHVEIVVKLKWLNI